MSKYKATKDLVIDGTNFSEGSEIELTEEEAASRVKNGSLVLVSESSSIENVDATIKRESTPKKLEEIKAQGAKDKKAGNAAPRQTNEERNFNTGRNIVGVQSPDASVGETVPVDIVMPGQVVDPKTGKVLEGSGSSLSTPQPLPPTELQAKDRNRIERHKALEATKGK